LIETKKALVGMDLGFKPYEFFKKMDFFAQFCKLLILVAAFHHVKEMPQHILLQNSQMVNSSAICNNPTSTLIL
jgi:hypothetical protein